MNIAELFANSDIDAITGMSDNPDQIVSISNKWDKSDNTVFLGKSTITGNCLETIHWVAETGKSGELVHTCNFGANQEEAVREYLDRAFGVNM